MRLLAARRLVLLVTLAVPSFAPPQQIELRIKGTLGESYDVQTSVQIELAASAVDTPDQIEMQLRVRTRAVQRFEVLDVRFNGNVRFLTTGLRVQSEIRINGQTAFAFDSDNPGGREFAAANPQAVQLLALLDAEVEIEQDPSGRILDYVASGAGAEITAQAETHFEEAVARDAVILPSGPVEIGASWQGGAREFRFPGFGAVSYPLIVTLTAIESLNGEQVAMLSLRAGEPTYTAAAGAQTGVQVESFGLDGEIRFSIDRGRILFQLSTGKLSILVQEADGRWNRMAVDFFLRQDDPGGPFVALPEAARTSLSESSRNERRNP